MRGNANRWFMAGTIAGALGMGIGLGLSNGNGGKQMKRARRNVANMAVRVSQDAGEFIGGLGQNLANKMR